MSEQAEPRVQVPGSSSTEWLVNKVLPVAGVTAIAWSLLAAFIVYAL